MYKLYNYNDNVHVHCKLRNTFVASYNTMITIQSVNYTMLCIQSTLYFLSSLYALQIVNCRVISQLTN